MVNRSEFKWGGGVRRMGLGTNPIILRRTERVSQILNDRATQAIAASPAPGSLQEIRDVRPSCRAAFRGGARFSFPALDTESARENP